MCIGLIQKHRKIGKQSTWHFLWQSALLLLLMVIHSSSFIGSEQLAQKKIKNKIKGFKMNLKHFGWNGTFSFPFILKFVDTTSLKKKSFFKSQNRERLSAYFSQKPSEPRKNYSQRFKMEPSINVNKFFGVGAKQNFMECRLYCWNCTIDNATRNFFILRN